MVSVVRDSCDADPERWPALTRSLVTAAGIASTALDLAIRQFRKALIYVVCDDTGEPVLVRDGDGGCWVHVYSRREWVPGFDVGQDVDSLSLTGLELTRRLPEGTGVRLDVGHSHSLAIHARELGASDLIDGVDR